MTDRIPSCLGIEDANRSLSLASEETIGEEIEGFEGTGNTEQGGFDKP